jgi:ABC-type Mn2+/Zn2+ transport system ATPase subunit
MAEQGQELTPEEVLAIDCTGLTYAFAEGLESALDGVDLQLSKGDRCLVVGANGGKSYRSMCRLLLSLSKLGPREYS